MIAASVDCYEQTSMVSRISKLEVANPFSVLLSTLQLQTSCTYKRLQCCCAVYWFTALITVDYVVISENFCLNVRQQQRVVRSYEHKQCDGAVYISCNNAYLTCSRWICLSQHRTTQTKTRSVDSENNRSAAVYVARYNLAPHGRTDGRSRDWCSGVWCRRYIIWCQIDSFTRDLAYKSEQKSELRTLRWSSLSVIISNMFCARVSKYQVL